MPRVLRWIRTMREGTQPAWLLVLLLASAPLPAVAQQEQPLPPPAAQSDSLHSDLDPSTTLETLVKRVARQVVARYERPWGRVVERRRGRVYIVPQGMPPRKGVTAPGTARRSVRRWAVSLRSRA